VLFVHGFESDAQSPRTVPISRRLAKRGLIGARVELTGHGRSEGELEDATDEQMAKDVALAVSQVKRLHEVHDECLSLVGAGTGATLALEYAAHDPAIRSIVVRGPMSGDEIERAIDIKQPTMLVYAEREQELGEQKRRYGDRLPSTHKILEIPDATRLFNDAISLEMMINASVDWIVDHLPRAKKAAAAAAAATETADDGAA
jgi:dienelactone hydrolase